MNNVSYPALVNRTVFTDLFFPAQLSLFLIFYLGNLQLPRLISAEQPVSLCDNVIGFFKCSSGLPSALEMVECSLNASESLMAAVRPYTVGVSKLFLSVFSCLVKVKLSSVYMLLSI